MQIIRVTALRGVIGRQYGVFLFFCVGVGATQLCNFSVVVPLTVRDSPHETCNARRFLILATLINLQYQ